MNDDEYGFIRSISRARNYAARQNTLAKGDESAQRRWKTLVHNLSLLDKEFETTPLTPTKDEKFKKRLSQLLGKQGDFFQCSEHVQSLLVYFKIQTYPKRKFFFTSYIIISSVLLHNILSNKNLFI